MPPLLLAQITPNMFCVLQVAKALQYLHEANPQVLHRDLKAENLLLTEKGRDGDIRVMDFGLTKLRRAQPQLQHLMIDCVAHAYRHGRQSIDVSAPLGQQLVCDLMSGMTPGVGCSLRHITPCTHSLAATCARYPLCSSFSVGTALCRHC